MAWYVSYDAMTGLLMREGEQAESQFLEPGMVGFCVTPSPVLFDEMTGARVLEWDAPSAASGNPGYRTVEK